MNVYMWDFKIGTFVYSSMFLVSIWALHIVISFYWDGYRLSSMYLSVGFHERENISGNSMLSSNIPQTIQSTMQHFAFSKQQSMIHIGIVS